MTAPKINGNAAIENLFRLMLGTGLMAIRDADPSNPASGIEGTVENYTTRNHAIYEALHRAMHLGYPAGIRPDPDDPQVWCIAYIDLPTGQVSWHLPAYTGTWDGHSTQEKYERIGAYYATCGDCSHPWHSATTPDHEPVESKCPQCGDSAEPGSTGPSYGAGPGEGR